MGRATGLRHNPQRRAVIEHAGKRIPSQTTPFDPTSIRIGEGELEHVPRKVATVVIKADFGVAGLWLMRDTH